MRKNFYDIHIIEAFNKGVKLYLQYTIIYVER